MATRVKLALEQIAAVWAVMALSLAGTPSAAPAAGMVAGLGNLQTATGKVTVKSVDAATRHLVLANASGETFTVKAPEAMHNFGQIKVGDTIKATYTVETEFVVSSPNTPLPKDTEVTVAARAAKGELPAGVVANHVIVSGAVLAIDRTNHTLRLVNPRGGEVHTIHVRDADRQKALAQVKVGDTITAYITEALLLSVDPA